MKHQNLNIENLAAKITLKYGVKLDETSLTILTILQKEIGDKITMQNQKLDQAANAIERSKRSLSVDSDHPRWQAFWFGMGKWGVASCLLIILLGIYTQFYISEQRKKKFVDDWCWWYKSYYSETKGMSKSAAEEWLANHPMPAQ
jgi:hypothetical protein